jgi:phospholipid N-methyltransferase
MNFTATYSPDDNKLRLYASSRLDAELYARVKAAGFKWAPKQELFVAPMWTPQRADLCEELAGEIEDEDKSLCERAEERAERFDDYSDKRAQDYERTSNAVKTLADGIPLGQPILIGHHSERHARKDAERIENGMKKAVKMWETSQYWKSRAAGALMHAKYKELPAVRARRIKGIEADKRKQEKNIAEYERALKLWNLVDQPEKWKAKTDGTVSTREDRARQVANMTSLRVSTVNADGTTCAYGGWSAYDVLRPEDERYKACPAVSIDEVIAKANSTYPRYIAHARRWIDHYNNRLEYERAMLAEAGGLVSDQHKFEVGGKVLRRGQWFTILKVNPQSVTVSGHWATTVTFDEIKDYQAPTAEHSAAVAKAMKTPPLCNYPGEGFRHMTKAELDAEACRKWSDFPKTKRIAATDTHGAHRVQQTRAQGKQWDYVGVYITDAKRKDPPPKDADPAPLDTKPVRAFEQPTYTRRQESTPAEVDAMRDAVKTGVQIVTAPQLFPTPRDLAQRVADMADVQPGHDVLEPSAGTGMLIGALGGRMFGHNPDCGSVMAVEINRDLAQRLQAEFPLTTVHCCDFLECGGIGLYDRIVMNPPFENGSDIKHIQHARKFLRPGGRLVAICANGPRQREQLMPLADHWEDLPAGTFKAAGTNVNTALLVIGA